MLVRRELTGLEREFPELRVEKVDILTDPGRVLRQRIRMIPTLQADDRKLSGIFLRSSAIREFVQKVLHSKTAG